MQEINKAIEWYNKDHTVSLAIVLKTWGSAPRKEGSILAVREDGRFEGSVSGGCMEGDIIASAIEGLKLGSSQTIHYDNDADNVWSATLACGSKIDIALFQLTKESINTLEALSACPNKEQLLTIKFADTSFHLSDNSMNVKKPKRTEDEFSIPFHPPLKLIIIGAVHIAQTLALIATQANYQVTIVDPREAFATEDRFQGTNLALEWPDDYLQNNKPDRRTAVVTLTHDPKLDDAALIEAFKSDAFYIGSLGSKLTHAKRLDRLKTLGVADEHLQRIHGPVGLDIAAINPPEIAISIMAEITAVLRQSND